MKTLNEEVAGVELYQPSNGTEGDYFMEKFCDNCYHESGRGNESPEGSCPIPIATMVCNPGDSQYPNQWRYADGKPTCISFFERKVYEIADNGKGETT
jgi:hypothetical protein